MLTRFEEVVVVDANGNPLPPPKYPLRYLETSSPGLRGQSGGPTFDEKGAIWALQAQTVTYPLDLEAPKAALRVREHIEHQFLNVGRGIHAETIIGLLEENCVPSASR